MESLARILRAAGITPPRGERLRGYSLAGDLAANALYFAPIVAQYRVAVA